MITVKKQVSHQPEFISLFKLKEWVKNFLKMPDKEIITRSALVRYEELESFMIKAKQIFNQVDGFRIYFIRFSSKDFTKFGKIKEEVTKYYEFTKDDDDLTQVALAVVPTYNFQYETLPDDKGKSITGKQKKPELVLDDKGRKLIYAKDCITKEGKVFMLVIGHPMDIEI
jgi:hypothetical protein